MGTEFLRLRRKNALWRFGRSALTGMAVALLLAGGLMIFFKLTSTNGRMLLSAAVGAGAGILAAVIRWLALRRSDLRAAEQIDSEHDLKERVQTMIAFRDQDSVMLQLQRQDTEEKLKAVSKYGVTIWSQLGHFAMVALAAVVLCCGLILPARAEVEPPVYVEPEYDASAWQIASLEELIVHVQESNMAEPAKGETVAQLQELRKALDGNITVSAFKAQVIEVIGNVYACTDRTNSNDDIHDVVYEIDHEVADDIAYVAGCLDNLEFGADVEDVGYQLGQEWNLPTIGQLADELAVQLDKIPADYIPNNSYTEEDTLYRALVKFAQGLQDVAALVEAAAEADAISGRMGEVVHTLKSEANLALEQQTATKQECVYVVESLCDIFAISPSECPPDPDPTYSKEVDEEDVGDVGGGAGGGDMQYAGDEQVYDYKQDQHVSYTEVVSAYYAAMIQASLEGELSEEMIEFILKYFSQLYTG